MNRVVEFTTNKRLVQCVLVFLSGPEQHACARISTTFSVAQASNCRRSHDQCQVRRQTMTKCCECGQWANKPCRALQWQNVHYNVNANGYDRFRTMIMSWKESDLLSLYYGAALCDKCIQLAPPVVVRRTSGSCKRPKHRATCIKYHVHLNVGTSPSSDVNEYYLVRKSRELPKTKLLRRVTARRQQLGPQTIEIPPLNYPRSLIFRDVYANIYGHRIPITNESSSLELAMGVFASRWSKMMYCCDIDPSEIPSLIGLLFGFILLGFWPLYFACQVL